MFTLDIRPVGTDVSALYGCVGKLLSQIGKAFHVDLMTNILSAFAVYENWYFYRIIT